MRKVCWVILFLGCQQTAPAAPAADSGTAAVPEGTVKVAAPATRGEGGACGDIGGSCCPAHPKCKRSACVEGRCP
jgi:hypothetical protein